ncbi:hypothetical protein AVEN_72727-1 [Araneus ventricosus]|uniref:Uncharacterized protein n=1 Tax=Araneus ventricosus TaxID=182803 RepID=A0A4Y2DNK3_ARAVE|nr:hypothetical protein AVEN_72727-1 [Araneus ventricosus]
MDCTDGIPNSLKSNWNGRLAFRHLSARVAGKQNHCLGWEVMLKVNAQILLVVERMVGRSKSGTLNLLKQGVKGRNYEESSSVFYVTSHPTGKGYKYRPIRIGINLFGVLFALRVRQLLDAIVRQLLDAIVRQLLDAIVRQLLDAIVRAISVIISDLLSVCVANLCECCSLRDTRASSFWNTR